MICEREVADHDNIVLRANMARSSTVNMRIAIHVFIWGGALCAIGTMLLNTELWGWQMIS